MKERGTSEPNPLVRSPRAGGIIDVAEARAVHVHQRLHPVRHLGRPGELFRDRRRVPTPRAAARARFLAAARPLPVAKRAQDLPARNGGLDKNLMQSSFAQIRGRVCLSPRAETSACVSAACH